jgi:hypothetical protein
MTITISLPPETEEKLLKRAAESGVAADALARELLEQALNGGGHAVVSGQPGATLDKVLAPFRKEVQDSGMSDEEVKEFFTEVRDEVRSEKRARRTQA